MHPPDWFKAMYEHYGKILQCKHSWRLRYNSRLGNGTYYQQRVCKACNKAEVRTKRRWWHLWSSWEWEPLP